MNSGSDIRWVGNSTTRNIYTGKEDIVNKVTTSSDYTYAMYTEKSNGEVFEEVVYYSSTAATEATKQSNVKKNANDYADNYSFFYNNSGQSSNSVQQNCLLLPCADERNQVISFNMNYTGRTTEFLSRFTAKSTYAYPTKAADGSFYGVIMNNGGGIHRTTVTPTDGPDVGVETDVFLEYKKMGKSYKVYTKNEAIGEANKLNVTQVNDFTQLLQENDIINVVYGTYDEGNSTFMVFELYNVTRGLYIIKEVYDTKALDETDYTTFTGMNSITDNKMVMKICLRQRADWDKKNPNCNAVTIGGVNEPLLKNGYDTTALAGEYKEDNQLSSVNLPEDYRWKDGTQPLLAGTHEYDAYCDYEYYGNQTAECKVTVTAEALPYYELTLKDMNGSVIDTDGVKQGVDYTFRALTSQKAFVAYKMGDNLYDIGDTVEVNENSEATLLEADFTMNNKVSVRLINDDENYYGGLRYMAQMPATDWEKISSNDGVTLNTMIIPTDLIDGDLDVDEANAQKEEATVADMTENGVDYKIALFAITNIKHQNYDRQFTGAAYLTVTYADGGVRHVMTEAKSASAYDLAVAAYTDHTASVALSTMGSYGDGNVEVLKRYINGVVDISYVVDGDTLTIALANIGLQGLDRVYELDETKTNVEKTDDNYTVSVTLNVAGSVLKDLLEDGESQAPVIVRNNNNDNYTSVADTLTHAYDVETDTLVLTFVVNA